MQTHSLSPLFLPLNLSYPSPSPRPQPKNPIFPLLSRVLSPKSPFLRRTHVPFSSPVDGLGKESELELLGKPSPIPIPDDSEPSAPRRPPDMEEALAPFLKFFKRRESDSEAKIGEESEPDETREPAEEEKEKEEVVGVRIQYYDPKPGDFVVGVVVSGNENKLDVNIGADMLGTMLTKEVLPLYEAELPYLLCDLGRDAGEFLVPGKMGIVKDEEALSGRRMPGRPVVEVGTVLFAEVLGRTLSGRPLLSTRRMFRRVAWHRVRQIKQLNEPIEVKIFEWNTGGLLTRIEGLRAFLPKAELMNRINNFSDLKDNVGRQMLVCICKIDEATNNIIISEKEAWDILYLKEGTLLEGTVRKIFPYGAQVRIGETNRSGLLHISNITRSHVTSVSDVLKVDEKVKVLVVKSMFPDKISLSIADLESEPGLFLSNKEKVFSEAEEMAKKYRQRLPLVSATRKLKSLPDDALPFDDEARLYSNWKWFKFEQHNEGTGNDSTIL
ncbi:protein PIGMENT DEFECTIVE 338, chloroplastic isoform X1 [Phoenix dactylifera]|uniref:Protein PIGMENT DEFECTIVE 338, chloroplastic isoform X1 n=1 Tax=Phoenix dactylifera TaxID=42345 RepID=A0A8B7CY18_PHODC|nr:protein PIGMENT DEFECTIVE 338, chloroplastic isoform X1 [Phoenix dactylifera]